MKKTIVVAGFPGIGKTTYTQNNPHLLICDSDSSQFPKDETWPQNYVDHILSNIGVVDVILISTHDVVLKAMRAAGILFTVVVPQWYDKEDYVWGRIANRVTGLNNKEFCQLIYDNWDNWLGALTGVDSPYCSLAVDSLDDAMLILDYEAFGDSFGECPFCHQPFALQICDHEGNWKYNSEDYLYDSWSGLAFYVTHHNGKKECPIRTREQHNEYVGYDNWYSVRGAIRAFQWKIE